jgi:uncharacterized protein (DUF983 family)
VSSGYHRRVSPFTAGFRRCCPRCGRGRLFQSYLKVAPQCGECDLDFAAHDAGDGPAVFVILILGFIVVGLALWVDLTYRPPLWFHAILWSTLILGGTLTMLPVLKALLIALQFKHRRDDYE